MDYPSINAIMRPLSKPGGYVLLAAYAAWFGFSLARNAGDGLSLGWVFFFNGLVGIPVVMVAENLVAVMRLDENGIRWTGFLNRTRILAWSDIVEIRLHSGRGRYRDMRLHGKRKKIAFSSMRRDFWHMARVILAMADRKGLSIKTSFLSSREQWLAAEKVP